MAESIPSLVRLNVVGYFPDGSPIPVEHVSAGTTSTWSFPSPVDAVAFLDRLESRPVYYSIVSDAVPLEGANAPWLRQHLEEVEVSTIPLESFLSPKKDIA